MMDDDKFIELPNHGRLMVVTDLHGNFEDYKSYVDLWDENDPDFHIVFTGDLIHSIHEDDGSIEILDDVIDKSNRCSNFHVLLGNHEWAHIVNKDIYKNNENLLEDFINLVSFKKGYVEPSLTNYIKFFKTMPFFLKTANGLFVSHSGPSDKIDSIERFNEVLEGNYSDPILYDFLWNRFNRFNDYTRADVEKFLELMGLKYMLIGHNVVESYTTFGNQV